MSITGPGCEHCEFTGRVTFPNAKPPFNQKPCDRCGGISQQFANAKLTGGGTRHCIPDPDPRDARIAALEADNESLRADLAEARRVLSNSRLVASNLAADKKLLRSERDAAVAVVEGLRAKVAELTEIERLANAFSDADSEMLAATICRDQARVDVAIGKKNRAFVALEHALLSRREDC